MMIQAEEVDEGISESNTKAILHFQISGPANLSFEVGDRGRRRKFLIPDQSYSNKQQEQGFSELWLVTSQRQEHYLQSK